MPKFRHLLLLFFVFSCCFTTSAHVFRILDDEMEALQCRIDLMVSAKKELIISSYIVRPDLVGLSMLHLMTLAAAKGVKVRLLVDAVGTKIEDPLLDYLSTNGVEIQFFNSFRLFELHSLLDRMHDKVLIKDMQEMIVGGRNMSNAYFILPAKTNFVDREIYCNHAATAADLRMHFYSMWNHEKMTNRPLKLPISDKKLKIWRQRLLESWQNLRQLKNLHFSSTIDWAAVAPTNGVHATYDNFRRKVNGKVVPYDRKDRRGTIQLIALIDSAQYSIDLENPYFHPSKQLEKALQRALNRGVKITLLTNSECNVDILVMQSVYRRYRPRYLKMGIEIWEYAGADCLHTKSIVIDSARTVVGSYNLHPMSEVNNTEVNIWVTDTSIARQNLSIMRRYLMNANKIEVSSETLAKCKFLDNPNCSKKSRKLHWLVHTISGILAWYI